MQVMILPVSIFEATVVADGIPVGNVAKVAAPVDGYVGFDGYRHHGERWLPVDVPAHVEGPTTKAEAALLLLALHGHDPEQSIRALGLNRKKVA